MKASRKSTLPVFAVIATVLALLSANPAPADQRDPRLAGLFARLSAGIDADEAARIDREIWSIWLESGNEEIDRLMQQGTIAMTTQAWPAALEAFDLIIERRPDFAEGWNKRATLYYLLDRYEESIRDVERTLALEPRHYGAISGMGLIEVERERLPEALDWFGKALAVNPHLAGIRALAEQLETRVKGKPI